MKHGFARFLGGLPLRPYSIISLWEMRKFFVAGCLSMLSRLERDVARLRGEDKPVGLEHAKGISARLRILEKNADELNLIISKDRCWRLAADLEDAVKASDASLVPNGRHLEVQISDVILAFQSEVMEIKFVFVPKNKIEYFNKDHLFGPSVASKIPSASEDIRQAGSCFALEFNNATVFHLMRAVEHSLRELARKLRVKPPKTQIEYADWKTVTDAAEKKVQMLKNKPGRRTKKMQELERFQSLLKEFGQFKDVFRNSIMHVREDYDEPKAQSAMNHVGGFMKRLAEVL